jgi:hypothetical protein
MDLIADIMVHLAEMLLPDLKTNTRSQNRQSKAKHPEVTTPQQRKLENKNRGGRDTHRKQCLLNAGGKDFVVHVHSPLTKLPEQRLGCTACRCPTNAIDLRADFRSS